MPLLDVAIATNPQLRELDRQTTDWRQSTAGMVASDTMSTINNNNDSINEYSYYILFLGTLAVKDPLTNGQVRECLVCSDL